MPAFGPDSIQPIVVARSRDPVLLIALGDQDVVKNEQTGGWLCPTLASLVTEFPIALDYIQSQGVVNVFPRNKSSVLTGGVLVSTEADNEPALKQT